MGDAENGLPMLRACALGVVVTVGARGSGVIELLDRLLAGTLPPGRRPGALTRAGAATQG